MHLNGEDDTIQDMARISMSHVDAAWLHAENLTNLVIIHGLLLFDDPLDVANVRSVLQSRLVDPFPRFRQRIVWRKNTGVAWWEDVEAFEIDDHIEHHQLTGSLADYLSQLMSKPLPFDRPPWQLYIIDEIDGQGSAVFIRVHHTIGDGIALTRVLLSMTDGGIYRPVLKQPAMGRSRWAMFKTSVRGVGTLVRLILKPNDNESIFKGKNQIEKQAVWSRPIPLPQVKALRKTMNGTVNDVLLTVICGALRAYQLEAGRDVIGSIRASIPVNLRPLDGPIKLGNQFGVVLLTLPIDVADPLERINVIKQRMNALKKSPEAVITYGLLNFFGRNPPPMIRFYFKLFSSKATAVMTNVPGPTNQVSFAGTPLKHLMFWVPQPSQLGLGISIMSYNDEVMVGIVTDAGLVPDPDKIIDLMHEQFDQLCDLAKSPVIS